MNRINLDSFIAQTLQCVQKHNLEKPGEYARWLWGENRNLGLNEYGCADAANILYSIGSFPSAPEERAAWIQTLQSLQNAETGLYSEPTHHTIHTTAHCTAALELFEKLHFQDGERIWDSYPFELSGGMNQRAGIAIAMLMNPAVLLADEPTSALDMAVQRQVVEEMLHVREAFGTAIIIVTHDIGVVSAMADSIVVLSNGRVMEYGTAKDVLENPQNDYTVKLLSAVPRLRREKA